MTVVTYNIEGFNRNFRYLESLINTFTPKLIFLQELWVPYSQEDYLNSLFTDYTVQIATPDQFTPTEDRLSSHDHTWHGVALLWHESLNSEIISIKNTHHRFTGVKLNLKGIIIIAMSAYLPTSGKDDEYTDCLGEMSTYIMENNTDKGSVLIGGDFNCSEKSSSRRIHCLQEFCEQHDLEKYCVSEPTFHHPNGTSSSNIDFFLASFQDSSKLVNIWSQCNQDNPDNFSGHDPVLGALWTLCSENTNYQSSKYSHTYTNFEPTKITWNENNLEKYQVAATHALTEYESFFDAPEFIPLKCQLYSEILVRAAEMYLGVKSRCLNKKSKVSPQIHLAWAHLQRCFKIWKKEGKIKCPSSSSFQLYKQARARFQHTRRHQFNLLTIKTNNDLMFTKENDRKKHFQLLKKIRGVNSKKKLTTLVTPSGTYYGEDILEGFANDVEELGKHVGESSSYDNEFYRLCVEDNKFIFDFTTENDYKIPEMKIEDLDKIIDKEMKRNKACDIYKLTAEHLKFAGKEARLVILNLMNNIIENIHSLACSQIKAGLGTSVYKSKKKPVSQSSSYRRITVTPQLGSILDRYLDPLAEEIFSHVQSPDQYGFTKNLSYLMASVLRGECQRWALDCKKTCFGVSFDGQAAFPSVDREIQVRELYTCGETGDLLRYSHHTYQNTVCKMKLNGKLSREIAEYRGARQGHKRASGHFKSYINPCLNTANSPQIGFFIGPICISVIADADDTYILSDNPRNLQNLIDIVGHYGKRYRLIFGADKTTVTVTGSKHDMEYYNDINIWSLNGEKLRVAEDNEHLGLLVSGIDEEIKNIDKNIRAARNCLHSFLGNIFNYRCKVSPSVQYHTWSVFIKPVLKSGLSALPIRPQAVKTLRAFHHKILRAILKLSSKSPLIPLYFLLGELPIEASLHLDILSLFWNIWSNAHTKSYEVLRYLLVMADSSSLTWAAHVRILFQLYNLPDPVVLLASPPWPKDRWKAHTMVVVTSHHEAALRKRALQNYKLRYLNVQTLGLTTRVHPVIGWVVTTQDVALVRPHMKMLAGDYLCGEYLARDRGLDPQCKLCRSLSDHSSPPEDLEHLLTKCRATSDIRQSKLPGLLNTIAQFSPHNALLCNSNPSQLTQFILDCTSLNLTSDVRIAPSSPGFTSITRTCSDLIFAIHRDRTRQLKTIMSSAVPCNTSQS